MVFTWFGCVHIDLVKRTLSLECMEFKSNEEIERFSQDTCRFGDTDEPFKSEKKEALITDSNNLKTNQIN